MDSTKRVVLVGSRGLLAAPIRAALRQAGWTITAVDRGDDPKASLEGADAVIVLHSGSHDHALYETVLGAVTESLADVSTVQRVVAVTPVPMRSKERESALARFRAAETECREGGVSLVVLRHGLLVGTERHRGPADGVLFASPVRWVPVPADGTQEVRPLLVDDLADVVVRALEDLRPDEEQAVEGPKTVSVSDLVTTLNGRGTRVLGFRPWARKAVMVVTVAVLPALGLAGGLAGAGTDAAIVLLLVAMAVYTTGLLAGGRLARAERRLPAANLLLSDEPPPRPEFRGVPLRAIGGESGYDVAAARQRQQQLRASLRRYRAESGSWVIATFLIFLGLAGVVVGGHDAVFAGSLGMRLAGTLMLAAGALTTAGGIALLIVGWPGRYVVAFVGGCVAVGTLAVLFVAALVNGDPPAGAFASFYLMLLAIACCFVLARRGWTVVRRFLAEHGRQAAGSIAAGGAVVLLGQFLYTTLYLPTVAATTVSVDTSLSNPRPLAGRIALDAAVTIENPTKNAVNVVGSTYVVRVGGVTSRQPHSESSALPDAARASAEETLMTQNPVRGYVDERPATVADRGMLTTPGTFLEPGEKIHHRFVAFVPKTADVASLSADVSAARRRFEVEPYSAPGIIEVDGGRVVVRVERIADPSWIHRLTRSNRYVHTVAAYESAPVPSCGADATLITWVDGDEWTDPERACFDASEDLAGRFQRHYGLVLGRTSTQTTIDP